MKNFLILIILSLSIFSCTNKEEEKEIKDFNSFLKLNYESNIRNLNDIKGIYYMTIENDSTKIVKGLAELENDYNELIIEIDNAKTNKNISLDITNTKYITFLNNIRKIVKNDKKNIINSGLINFETKSNNDELKLNIMKNNLVIAFSNTYRYASYSGWIACGLRTFNHIDTKVKIDENNKVKITLLSKIAQGNNTKRRILVNNITLNGSKKNIKYDIIKNYSFADIDIETKNKGKYKLYGTIKYYDLDLTYEIPFNEEFIVK